MQGREGGREGGEEDMEEEDTIISCRVQVQRVGPGVRAALETGHPV